MKLVSDKTGWVLLGVHGAGAMVWFAMMPGGFPVDHMRFWMNRVLPVLLVVACVGAGVLWVRGRGTAGLRMMLVCLGCVWGTATVLLPVVYPISGWRVVISAMLIAGLLWLSAYTRAMRVVRVPRWSWVAAACAGVAAGAFVTLSQRSPAPSTHPLNAEMPSLSDTRGAVASVEIGPGARMAPERGEIELSHGRYSLMIEPLLTFSSRSPDRCWTNLAPPGDRLGPGRTLQHWSREANGTIAASYKDDGESVLQGRVLADGAIELCAWSRLPVNVYSHLNSFTQLFLTGHRHLELVFSPCGGKGVEPKFMEYPVGAPERCAALFADGRFAVLQASSAEKGPYRELAGGLLARSDALVFTVRDEGRDIVEITWEDFAAQAGRDLSPTAGYGLPVNALEFSLSAEDPASAMEMYVTLAGTSVGRGWDSVGHAAGTYRNRMRVRWLIE